MGKLESCPKRKTHIVIYTLYFILLNVPWLTPMSHHQPFGFSIEETTMQEIQNIVILTGAGISAESGIATFRTKGAVSYWETTNENGVPILHRVEDVLYP